MKPRGKLIEHGSITILVESSMLRTAPYVLHATNDVL